jgi:endoglucanase
VAFVARFAVCAAALLGTGCAPPEPDNVARGTDHVRAARPLALRGIHLAGGEFGAALPGVEGVDYTWPTADEIDYFIDRGMTVFRLGFTWERLQPSVRGELEAAYFEKLDALVRHATANGAHVILDPHNFARYYGKPIGSGAVDDSVFADLWRRLALVYAGNANVIFNLVNEPHDLPTEQWVSAANAAIAAIREAGAKNVIHVPGNGYTSAFAWASNDYGTPNAVALLNIVDPEDNIVFEAHQYLDATSGGESKTCVSKTIGSERVAPFVSWLRANHKKGFIGELGGANNPTCNAAVENMLQSIEDSADVLTGWVWWAAGPDWGDYFLSLEPLDGKDRPQMKLLAPHLAH